MRHWRANLPAPSTRSPSTPRRLAKLAADLPTVRSIFQRSLGKLQCAGGRALSTDFPGRAAGAPARNLEIPGSISGLGFTRVRQTWLSKSATADLDAHRPGMTL